MHYKNSKIPLEAFGIKSDDMIVNLVYTLKASYAKPNGKFSLIFSESAIVDCHYIFSSFIVSLEDKLEEIKDKYPDIYKEAKAALEDFENWLEKRSITFCDFAYDISGVLTDQSSYYLTSEKNIVQNLNWKAGEIVDALTLATN